MTCPEVTAGVTDYLDGALGAGARPRFERHLDGCDDCRMYVAQFARTLNALGALRADDPGPADITALLDVFRAHVG